MITTPDYVTNGIILIDEALSWLYYSARETVNRYGERYLSDEYRATTNSGMVHELPGAPFTLRAYSWADCTSPDAGRGWGPCGGPTCDACAPNFSFPALGFEARWYKHASRGAECNKRVAFTQWLDIQDACLKWIRNNSLG